MQALKRKKDASMVRAIELVKTGAASVVVSCGNTGALMAGGTLKLRTMAGVARPALAAIGPRRGGHFVLLDAGANPEAKTEYLVHNAILGSHYCRVMLGIERPRIGLMSIGTEEGKGTALITETHEQLKRLGDLIHYVGPIEGFQVFTDQVDVVVCDGFTGNIALKSIEGTARFVTDLLRRAFTSSIRSKFGFLVSRPATELLRHHLDPNNHNGAVFMGLNGVVVKSHGSANIKGVAHAVEVAARLVEEDITARITQDLARVQAG